MGRLAIAAGACVGVCLVAFSGFNLANAQDAPSAAAMADGQDIFEDNCAFCHGAGGGGSEGPRLAGNERLQFISSIVGQIVLGSNYMPAFGNRLDNDEIAAVSTYIRNSWGNAFGGVTAEQVQANR